LCGRIPVLLCLIQCEPFAAAFDRPFARSCGQRAAQGTFGCLKYVCRHSVILFQVCMMTRHLCIVAQYGSVTEAGEESRLDRVKAILARWHDIMRFSCLMLFILFFDAVSYFMLFVLLFDTVRSFFMLLVLLFDAVFF
jgi:hypothetical protein